MGGKKVETAIFGGGCFWCTEAVFRRLKGVMSVVPGYAGGHTSNPTYDMVSSGGTGHAEVIKIEFDPSLISFRTLLTVFFATHDPTTKDRQGNDVGKEYRSVILFMNENQKSEAEKFIIDLNASNQFGDPIVTEVKPYDKFYSAESFHQEYYERNPDSPYCELVINPKLEKIQKEFAEMLNKQN